MLGTQAGGEQVPLPMPLVPPVKRNRPEGSQCFRIFARVSPCLRLYFVAQGQIGKCFCIREVSQSIGASRPLGKPACALGIRCRTERLGIFRQAESFFRSEQNQSLAMLRHAVLCCIENPPG